MSLKQLVHTAHQTLQTQASCDVRRSHVYELLAAALGYQSWASFHTDALLVDGGAGVVPDGIAPRVSGRARQMGYPQPCADTFAQVLAALTSEHRLGALRRSVLEQVLFPPRPRDRAGAPDDHADDWEDEDADWDEPPARTNGPTAVPDHFRLSALLLESLELAAAQDPRGHFMLAALHRCAKPNPYLYEESLKGRVLNTIEQGWVENYLQLEPRYRQYQSHLKAAATGGVRAAALEYGAVFGDSEFIALAERLEGDVDALEMAKSASTPEARGRWLRKAAEEGSWQALEELAYQGDAWAEDRMGSRADSGWLRRVAGRALDQGDTQRAWTWQYVALARGGDLTRSTLAARHDGGLNDGQFYDSDFGGPLYVDGDESLNLPELSKAEHKVAKAKAQEIMRY
jgi:hypothetical protein